MHLGDVVDRRKTINFSTSSRMRDMFLEPLAALVDDVHFLVGNHDAYFKNTNSVNALQELLASNEFFNIYEKPTEIKLDGLDVLLIPWICSETADLTRALISQSSARVAMGHLELEGFSMHRGIGAPHGASISEYEKFDMVLTGHYHHKSSRNNIHYLGAPYEMIWSDFDDPRGFHILDTDTLRLEFIPNHHSIFHKITYSGGPPAALNISSLSRSYVKLLVSDRGPPEKFDHFLGLLENQSLADLQIIEDSLVADEMGESEILGIENSLQFLLTQVKGIGLQPPAEARLQQLFHSLYSEAMESGIKE